MLCHYVPFVVSFILTIPNGYCQLSQLTYNTIPEQINGGSPLVLGIENSNDVKIVCEIFFNITTPFITAWRLVSEDDTNLLRFDINGAANSEASQPFAVTGDVLAGSQTSQANLTIIDFTSSLDMSVLECASSFIILGNFTLRLTGIVDTDFYYNFVWIKIKGKKRIKLIIIIIIIINIVIINNYT